MWISSYLIRYYKLLIVHENISSNNANAFFSNK